KFRRQAKEVIRRAVLCVEFAVDVEDGISRLPELCGGVAVRGGENGRIRGAFDVAIVVQRRRELEARGFGELEVEPALIGIQPLARRAVGGYGVDLQYRQGSGRREPRQMGGQLRLG